MSANQAVTKSERLAAKIVDDIRAGALQPGSQLPTRRDLAAEWGDHAAVAALRWLRDNGWIVTRVGSGAFVADPLPSDPPPVPDVQAALVDLDRRLREVEAELHLRRRGGGNTHQD